MGERSTGGFSVEGRSAVKRSAEEFGTGKWNKMTRAERLDLLQKLENTMARKQGRPARIVRSVDTSSMGGKNSVVMGYYDSEEKKYLNINKDMLDDNSPIPQSNYRVAECVMHEGRHAYQDDVIKGRIKKPRESEEVVESWKKNMGEDRVYYTTRKDGWALYRFQPVEDDANNFAAENMKKMEAAIKDLQDRRQYYIYALEKNDENRRLQASAKLMFGNKYKENILKKLEKDYEKLQKSKKKENKKTGGESDEKSDNVSEEKSSGKQGAVSEAGQDSGMSQNPGAVSSGETESEGMGM